MKTFFIVLLVTALMVNLSGAEAKPGKRTFIAVSLDQPLSGLHYKLDGKNVTVEIPAFAGSKKYTLPAGEKLTFFRTETPAQAPVGNSAAATASSAPIKPLAELKLDPDVEHYIVLFGPLTQGTYRTKAIANTETEVPFGSARVLNLSPQPVVMKCNQTTFQVAIGQSAVVSGEGDVLKLALALQKNGAWLEAYNNSYLHNADTRLTVILIRSDSEYFQSRIPGQAAVPPGPVQVFNIVETKAGT